jgi:photosystem II stability/assembly factor-like uncharacterized protein
MKKLLYFFLIIHIGYSAKAQWQKTNGPYGGSITCMRVFGKSIFAGTTFQEIFKSDDDGANWIESDSNISNLMSGGQITAFYSYGTRLFAGSGDYLFESKDNGSTWNTMSFGPLGFNANVISSLGKFVILGSAFNPGNAFSIAFSNDSGMTWSYSNLSNNLNYVINNFAIIGTTVFAGTSNGIFKSSDGGKNWTSVNTGSKINSLFIYGTKIIAGIDSGVIVSSDYGSTWKSSTGLINAQGRVFTIKDSIILLGTNNGVYISLDSCNSWKLSNTGLYNHFVHALVTKDNKIFAGTNASGVFVSNDNASNWSPTNNSLLSSSMGVTSIATLKSNLYAGTDGGGIFKSSDKGTTWTPIDSGLTDYQIYPIVVSGSNLYAGTYYSGVFISTNYGISWTPINNGLIGSVYKLFTRDFYNGYIFCGTDSGLFKTSNYGASWLPINISRFQLDSANLFDLATFGNYLFAATDKGLYRSSDTGVTWISVNSGIDYPYYMDQLSYGRNGLYAIGMWRIYFSNNYGDSWVVIADSSNNYFRFDFIEVNGTNIFTSNNWGTYLSADNGNSWTEIDSGLSSPTILTMRFDEKYIYAINDERKIYRRLNTELPSGVFEASLTNNNFNIYPNPTSNEITIQTSSTKKLIAQLFDITGKMVLGNVPFIKSTTINLSEQHEGMYFLIIYDENNNKLKVQKIVVIK